MGANVLAGSNRRVVRKGGMGSNTLINPGARKDVYEKPRMISKKRLLRELKVEQELGFRPRARSPITLVKVNLPD